MTDALTIDKTLPAGSTLTVEADTAEITLFVPADCPYFEGHFPEAPLLPGVVQLGWMLSAARILKKQAGPTWQSKNVKFLKPIKPETHLKLKANALANRVDVTLSSEESTLAKASFQFPEDKQ